MDASVGGPPLDSTNAPYILSATPYVYLIPCGNDIMRAPPLGDTDTLRSWTVQDQALPLPYNLGASEFNSNQFFSANGTLKKSHGSSASTRRSALWRIRSCLMQRRRLNTAATA